MDPFSPTRPSKFILHECSLGEAQAKLRLSPERLRLYASDTTHDAQGNYHETDGYQASNVMNDGKLQELPARDRPSFVGDHTSHCSSEFEFHQDRNNHVASEATSRSRIGWLKRDIGSSYASQSLDSVLETWKAPKPPKPPKPSFLTVFESTGFDTAPNTVENTKYRTHTGPEKIQQGTRLPVKDPQSSPPSKPHEHFNITLSNHAMGTDQQGISQGPAEKVIWRPAIRPARHRSPKRAYQPPIHGPEKPSPFPISTRNKLPLRLESTVHWSMDGEEQATTVTRGEKLLIRLKKKGLVPKKLKELALVTLSLHKLEQPVPLSESRSYVLRMGMEWSITFLNTLNNYNHERQLVSTVPMDGATNLLQLNFVVPMLLLRAIAFIAAATQDLKFPKTLSTIGKSVKALISLIIITTLWLLEELRSNTTSG